MADTSSVAAGVSLLRTETAVPAVPVFRSAYFPETVHRTVSSKTLDLQGCAPPYAHRNSCSSCSGVTHGLFSMNSPPDCSFRNAHAPGLRPSVCQSTGLVIPQTLDLQGFAPPQKGRLDPHACRFVDKRKVFHAGRRERISSEAEKSLSTLYSPNDVKQP